MQSVKKWTGHMLLRQSQAVVHCNGRSRFMKLNILLSVWVIVCLSERTLLLDLVQVKLFHSVPWERRMERSYSSYSFMTSELDGCEESTYRSGRALPPGERTLNTHCALCWVGPRSARDTEARGTIPFPLLGFRISIARSYSRSYSLYCLSFSGSPMMLYYYHNT
jgi:hypothetical protein